MSRMTRVPAVEENQNVSWGEKCSFLAGKSVGFIFIVFIFVFVILVIGHDNKQAVLAALRFGVEHSPIRAAVFSSRHFFKYSRNNNVCIIY